MSMNLILVIKFYQQNFAGKDIDIINFVRHFHNFIGSILAEIRARVGQLVEAPQ